MKAKQRWEIGALIALVLTISCAAAAFLRWRARQAALTTSLRRQVERTFDEHSTRPAAEELLRLIRQGAAPNLRDARGHTPLMAAAALGNLPLTRELVERGADVNAGDSLNVTPLLYAVDWAQSLPVTRLLLDHGADPNIRQAGGGETALLSASSLQNDALVQLLIQRGAEVNVARQDGGEQPLVHAAAWNQEETVRLLLARHARLDMRGEGGLTPLEAARKYKHPRIARLLERAGERE